MMRRCDIPSENGKQGEKVYRRRKKNSTRQCAPPRPEGCGEPVFRQAMKRRDTPRQAVKRRETTNIIKDCKPDHKATFSVICTVYVQYMYSICTLRKRPNTVHILYIYCTTGREGAPFQGFASGRKGPMAQGVGGGGFWRKKWIFLRRGLQFREKLLPLHSQSATGGS